MMGLRGLLGGCLVFAAVFVGGCGDGESSSGNGSAGAVEKQSGFAAGRVAMADGKPITAPGAAITVSIGGVSEAGERVQYHPVIKPDGTYRQKLAPGQYSFGRGGVEVQFEGQTYRFALEPVGVEWNKNRDAAEGITQDFVWKVTGERPSSDHDVNKHTNWYGGSIGVRFATYRNDIGKAPAPLPEGTPVTFTLKPTSATRVDGSPTQAITLERKFDARWNQCDALNDIPPAFYELTGVAKLADGATKPLLFEVTYAKFNSVQPIKFEPYLLMESVTLPLTSWVTE
jgi:hypothetical protein